MAVLYLVPTPLAPETHLLVLPAAVPQTVKDIKLFFVENLRTARRFLSSLKVDIVIDDCEFVVLDKRSEAKDILPYIKRMNEQALSAAVLSEAGCPGIADPGALAVSLAHQQQLQVMPLTGPSSVMLALMGSGFSGQSFAFHGYLPIDNKARKAAIKKLEKEVQQSGQTQLFIETPYRNGVMFKSLLAACLPDTLLCLAVNLTAPDEQLHTRTIRQWQQKPEPDMHKKPAIFLLGHSA